MRGAVEHPFAHMKTKAIFTAMAAKSQARNGLRFVFNCIGGIWKGWLSLPTESDPWDRWLYDGCYGRYKATIGKYTAAKFNLRD